MSYLHFNCGITRNDSQGGGGRGGEEEEEEEEKARHISNENLP